MHSVRLAPLVPALLALATFTRAPRATAETPAETPAENKAAARNLAIQGVQLAEREACDEAIPLFERAEALFHAPTILASLGECQVRLGRLVEGTETLRRVIREKLPADAPQAFLDAQTRAQALFDEYQPQIAQLTIEIEPVDVRPRLLVDGSPVSGAFVGVPRPTDPGAHHVEASADGHETAQVEISLSPGARETVRLTLQPRPRASSALTEGPQESSSSSTQRLFGYVGLGLGGALLSAGAITGAMAVGKENSLEQRCPDGRCPAGERGALDDANTMATVATVATLGGAAFGLTGLVLLLTADEEEEDVPAHAEVTPWLGWGSLGVAGTF